MHFEFLSKTIRRAYCHKSAQCIFNDYVIIIYVFSHIFFCKSFTFKFRILEFYSKLLVCDHTRLLSPGKYYINTSGLTIDLILHLNLVLLVTTYKNEGGVCKDISWPITS